MCAVLLCREADVCRGFWFLQAINDGTRQSRYGRVSVSSLVPTRNLAKVRTGAQGLEGGILPDKTS